MKEITMFQCELCCSNYGNLDAATKCETVGKESPLLKVGETIKAINYFSAEEFDNCVIDEIKLKKILDTGHFIRYTFEEFFDETDEWDTAYAHDYYGNEELIKHWVKD